MSTVHNDHYVPQFILKNFRSSRAGKLFRCDKDSLYIGMSGPRRVFREPDGDLVLLGPPPIKEKDGLAVLAGPPEFTTEIRAHLSKMENLWAPAIKYLVKTVLDQPVTKFYRGKVIPVQPVPPKHADAAALGKEYCLRQMIRPPEAGNELWSRHLEAEERALRTWIASVLGPGLDPSPEVRKLWQKHNRNTTRTGMEAEAEGLWNNIDSDFILTTWLVPGDARFVLGSRGGVWAPFPENSLWICPVHPHVALGVEGRVVTVEAMRMPDQFGHFVKGYVLPREGITACDINRASWRQCSAVVAARCHDITEIR